MTMNNKLYINANSLNPIFSVEGGIYRGSRLLLYGMAGSGKSTTCMTLALNELDQGNTVYYIDADFFGLHALKLQELYKLKYNIDFPVDKFKSVKEHETMIYNLWKAKGLHIKQADSMVKVDLALSEIKAMKKKPSLIIIDSISQYYRLDMIKSNDFKPAKIMMKIVANYVKYANEHSITLLFTAQRVSEVKHTLKKNTNPNSEEYRSFVGGEVLHHAMDNIVLFTIHDTYRFANTEKHRNSVKKGEIKFSIKDGLIA